jgi:hypothetical protein
VSLPSHDELQAKVVEKLRLLPNFDNVYLASVTRTFPKPDFIFIKRSREPQPQTAFEFKPPHSQKREYLTGLGQSISYLDYYPISYLVVPDEKIDDIIVPQFLEHIITNQGLDIGLVKYDASSFTPEVCVDGKQNPEIDVEKLEKELQHARAWNFWMDTSIQEVSEILRLINELKDKGVVPTFDREKVMSEIWSKVLSERYGGKKKPFKLNYQLFFDHLELWTADYVLTGVGNRLREISVAYGYNSDEFRDALCYLLLTKGGNLTLLKNVYEIQSHEKFAHKGNEQNLVKEIRKLREDTGVGERSAEIDDKIIPKFRKGGDEWLRVMICNMFERGFGKSLTQLAPEIDNRFPYMQNMLDTQFLLNNRYIRGKGYPINWMRIISLMQRGNSSLNVV